MTELTKDRLFGGSLQISQAKSGYRFSMDAVVLARQAVVNPGDRVLDLGTGCGVIALILAHLHSDISVYGAEIQKSQADIAAENVKANNLEDRITILCQDIKTLSRRQTSGPVDAVVCNPPHIEKARGRINPNDQLAVSRHEIKITLDDLVKTSQKMLCRSGRLWLIYPAERLTDVFETIRSHGIEPKQMTILYTREGENARRVLVKGIKGGRPGLTITPPLIIHHADGTYTAAAQRIFGQ